MFSIDFQTPGGPFLAGIRERIEIQIIPLELIAQIFS
jgi:hypothetical protein